METEKSPSSLSSLGIQLLSVGWTACAIGTIVFGMRIYVNVAMARKWDAAFWFSLATYFACLAATITMNFSVEYGLGNHVGDLQTWSRENALKYRWFFSGTAILALGLGKLAIISYLIIVQGDTLKVKPFRKWFMYFMAYTNVFVCVGITPLLWNQCQPTAKLWDESLEGHCFGRRRYQIFAYFWSSYEAVLDIVLSLYPITIFWTLQLPIHIKIGLVFLFATGLFAAAAGSVKTYYVYTITRTSDSTYQLSLLGVWFIIEVWIVHVVSCIPTIRPIFTNFCERSKEWRVRRWLPLGGKGGTPKHKNKPSRSFVTNITNVWTNKPNNAQWLPEQEDSIMVTTKVENAYEMNSGTLERQRKDGIMVQDWDRRSPSDSRV